MRHLKIYRAIQMIHRNGSIRQAADVLSVSPSALNRSIQGFEEELGVPVFHRIPGGVELTAAGELLILLIDQHMVKFNDLLAEMRSLQDGVRGTVAISLGEDLDAGLLIEAVAAFERDFPGVSVRIVPESSAARLKARQVDLAVLSAPETDEATEVLYAQRVPLMAWADPSLGQIAGIWDLLAHRLILPPEGTGSRAQFRHVLRRHRLSEGTVTTAPLSQMSTLLAQGARAGIAPVCALRPFATEPKAEPLARPLSLKLGDVQISVLRAVGTPMTKASEALSLRLQTALEAGAG
ncbi:MAG: LysR family transcriptional regulator [Pseudomonadota bacterium]